MSMPPVMPRPDQKKDHKMNQNAFTLGILRLVKDAGVHPDKQAQVYSTIMGFAQATQEKRAGAALGRLAGGVGKLLGRATGKGIGVAGGLAGRLGAATGRQLGGFAQGMRSSGYNPTWLRRAALWARQNPRAAGAGVAGAGYLGYRALTAPKALQPEPQAPQSRNPYLGLF